jgi:hypothetical protein
MKILIACEESQAVCKEFRAIGHEAYSADIQECSGGHPEWHIMQDVLPLLNGNCEFKTCDGVLHRVVGRWDMIIAFPPCTNLAVSGARHFARKIADGTQQKSIEFFMKFTNADCKKIAIENPIGIMSTHYRNPTQIIQPFEYGHPHRKATCLWLKGLPNLQPTNIVKVTDIREFKKKDGTTTTYSDWYNKGGKERQKNRSKTFLGIAKAMAEQWGRQREMVNSYYIENEQLSLF